MTCMLLFLDSRGALKVSFQILHTHTQFDTLSYIFYILIYIISLCDI